jgi:signal transduction histidine kinase
MDGERAYGKPGTKFRKTRPGLGPALTVDPKSDLGDTESILPGSTEATRLTVRVAALERENTDLRQRLERLEANSKVVSKVAHDFNNLLTIINGYSVFLIDRLDLNDEVRIDLQSISRASERAATLTAQLSELGRTMRGEAICAPKPTQTELPDKA